MCYVTPRQIAKQMGISPDKVCGWIRRGELRAIDTSDPNSKKARYRVREDWLEDFLLKRSVVPATKPKRRPKRQEGTVKEFY